MTITNDMRMAALQKSSPALQETYKSLELAQLLKLLMSQYSISNADFVDLIGDMMLGFYPKSELRKLLQANFGFTEEVAAHIEQDLKSLLFKIDGVPIVPPASREVQEPLERRPEHTEFLAGSKPLTREEVLRSLAPKRTMATDIESVKRGRESGPAGQTPSDIPR